MNKKSIFFAIMSLVIAGIFLSSCSAVVNISTKEPVVTDTYTFQTLAQSDELKTLQFNSEDEALEFLSLYSNQGDYGSNGIYVDMDYSLRDSEISVDYALDASSVAVPQAGSVKSESLDYSDTNVQVTGIDEGDILKTDGDYIYTISNNILYIIKAFPGEEAEVISTVKFENTPSGLFIYENNLAVFGNIGRNDPVLKGMASYIPNQPFSFLNIYDVSDRSAPKAIKDYKFEGSYLNSRMYDGFIYLVTTSYPGYARDYPLPVYYEGDVERKIDVSSVYYFPVPYDNPKFATIISINIKEPSQKVSSKSFLVEGTQNMYMSKQNIYITYTEYINEYELIQDLTIELLENKLSEKQKKYIEKVEATDGDVLSPSEKKAKILNVFYEYLSSLESEEREDAQDQIEAELKRRLEEFEAFEFTIINKIQVDNGEISPKSNNKVAGRIINQFSMDEYNGIFRIATTLSPRWSRYGESNQVSTNQVYALDDNLKLLDKLEGLAEDESIYSTRFIADKLYMVTFKQIDPFFVIDLSDPTKLKELGQLKIPGFSKYLHPYDETTIIGIGKDATETGRTKGLKISLFDVSDFSDPKEIASYISDERYSDSTALYEHKAFLFSKEKNLLVIPGYNYNYQQTSENYNGALVFDIRKDSITLRGLIDHSQGSERYYHPLVERSLYIEDLLYTKSLNLLRINDLDDLSSVKNLTLKYENKKIPIY